MKELVEFLRPYAGRRQFISTTTHPERLLRYAESLSDCANRVVTRPFRAPNLDLVDGGLANTGQRSEFLLA